MGRLLRPGGISVFSDVLVQSNVSTNQLPVILDTFHLNGLASAELYDKHLQAGGQKKILNKVDGGDAVERHFGYQLYTVTDYKKAELEGPNGISPKLLAQKKVLINAWIDAAEQNLMEQGWFVYIKE